MTATPIIPENQCIKKDALGRMRPHFQGTVAPETATVIERVQTALGIRQPGRALDVLIASWSCYGCPEDLGVDVSDIDMPDAIGSECAEAGSIAAGLAPLLMLVISFIALLALSGLVSATVWLPVETWLAAAQALLR